MLVLYYALSRMVLRRNGLLNYRSRQYPPALYEANQRASIEAIDPRVLLSGELLGDCPPLGAEGPAS